jgi:hypothetical protein
MNTENEKAVRGHMRDAFFAIHGEGKLDSTDEEFGLQCFKEGAAWQAALQSQSNTDGWKLVPVEPTQAMHDSWIYGKGPWSERYRAMLSAAPKAPRQQEQSGEAVTPYSLQTVVRFLCGEGPMDGVWFGEPHPRERGKYWWRKYLRAATSPATPAATASQESAPGQEAVASEIFKSYMKNCEDLRIAPDLYGAFQYAWDSAIAIHPTSTAIAAMVIKQAAEIAKSYCNYGYQQRQVEAAILALLPSAEAELEALLKDAGRYRALREHFKFANDSAQEIRFDASITPERSDKSEELDEAIEAAINISNGKGEKSEE